MRGLRIQQHCPIHLPCHRIGRGALLFGAVKAAGQGQIPPRKPPLRGTRAGRSEPDVSGAACPLHGYRSLGPPCQISLHPAHGGMGRPQATRPDARGEHSKRDACAGGGNLANQITLSIRGPGKGTGSRAVMGTTPHRHRAAPWFYATVVIARKKPGAAMAGRAFESRRAERHTPPAPGLDAVRPAATRRAPRERNPRTGGAAGRVWISIRDGIGRR